MTSLLSRLHRLKRKLESAPLGRQSVILSILVGLFGFISLGGMRLVYADAHEEKKTVTHPIQGKVVDQQGRPIADAQVALSTETIGVKISSGRLHPYSGNANESRIVITDEYRQQTPDNKTKCPGTNSGRGVGAQDSFSASYCQA